MPTPFCKTGPPISLATDQYLTRNDRAVFRPAFTPIVQARGRHIGVAEPFLDLGDIEIMRERVGGGGRAQRMDAKPVDLTADAGLLAVFTDNIAID